MRVVVHVALSAILCGGCGAMRPRPADLVALATRIDELCPARALPGLLESHPRPVTCPSEVAALDVELDRALDDVETISSAFERDAPAPACDAPWRTGEDLAVVAAHATRRDSRRRADDETRLRSALVRYHLRLASDARWTVAEHDIAREALLRLGLLDSRAAWGEAAEPYAILACRPRAAGVWETPDVWIDGRLPATSASMRGPHLAFVLRHAAVDGVRIEVRAFVGDDHGMLEVLARSGLHEIIPTETNSPGLVLFETERAMARVIRGTTAQLLVHAHFDDERRRPAVLRALGSITWDGVVSLPPISVSESRLPWLEASAELWSLCDAPNIGWLEGTSRCVRVGTSARPVDCPTTSTIATSDGDWAPACDVQLDSHGAASRIVPTREGHLLISTQVFDGDTSIEAIARAVDLLANVRLTAAR